MSEELLQKKIERQKRQIELLEQLIEDRSRDIFQVNEELQRNVDELQSTQRALVDASRKAGMADVATNVLHNVGNVLNSVNVSANVLSSLTKSSKSGGIAKAVALLRSQPDPGKFLTEDPRGKKLLDYLEGVGQAIDVERSKTLEELGALEQNIEHIKAIVMTQQSLARGGNVSEQISVRRKVSDVLRMAEGTLAKHQVKTTCDFSSLEDDAMTTDRHKLFQILLNLLTNAAQALAPKSDERQVWIAVRSERDRVVFVIKDNGVGIPTANLTKIFAHGFTTKADGHGFGLHSCANAAVEMGGRLEATSEGPGLGATFTLTLPRAVISPVSRRGAASLSP